MRYTITLNGAPIGAADFTPAEEFVTVSVTPLEGFSSISMIVRAASIAFADIALGGRELSSSPRIACALRRGAELGRSLELRDVRGTLIPTDFIELTEWPKGSPEIAAMIRFRHSHATIAATVQPGPVSTLTGAPAI